MTKVVGMIDPARGTQSAVVLPRRPGHASKLARASCISSNCTGLPVLA